MVRFSREIESAPWNREFPLEVERIYYEYVEPAILEIEEAFRSNNLLLALITKPIKTPDMWLAGLGLLLDAQYGGGSLPDLLGKALIAGGVTSSAVKVVNLPGHRPGLLEKPELFWRGFFRLMILNIATYHIGCHCVPHRPGEVANLPEVSSPQLSFHLGILAKDDAG